MKSRSTRLPIESAIRAHGARVTPARVRVLELLQSARTPLNHSDIERQLRDAATPGIDRVTLYRVLDWLAEAGLAHKAADARGVYRYAAATPESDHTQHLHFRCTDCGSVACLDTPPPQAPHLPKGYRLASTAFDVSGQCPDCAAPPGAQRRARRIKP
jgi:Fur family ferric uptake transcriptional regulator